MPLTTVKPKILAGQSLSETIDSSTGNPLFMIVPMNWTPANISFQLSSDGITFADMFGARAAEIIMPVRAGTSIPLAFSDQTVKGSYLKIRSGSRDFPIVQQAEVEFTVAIET